MRNGYADVLTGKRLVQVVGKPLRSRANGVAVHAVRPHADHPTQPTRSELEAAVKRVGQFGGVAAIEQVLDAGFGIGIVRAIEPGINILLGRGVKLLRRHITSEKVKTGFVRAKLRCWSMYCNALDNVPAFLAMNFDIQ